MTKPDFIIIGAMKSATSTLHNQLALQDGIFMSTPKEPNYFSDDEQYARGERWYSSLFFKAESNDLCGESSTHYTKLPTYPLTVERMARSLNNPKFIYVMRHPIDRLVSHYIHEWSQNKFKCDINQAIDQYEELTAYSCYARQLEPYIKQYGVDNILPIFTEAIRQNPQKQLEKVADFLGYEADVLWRDELRSQNVSVQRVRRFKGYHYLVESKLMAFLRRLLVPKSVRTLVKKELTMHKRPEIDAARQAGLIELFDKELIALEGFLGVELSCATYKDKVKNV